METDGMKDEVNFMPYGNTYHMKYCKNICCRIVSNIMYYKQKAYVSNTYAQKLLHTHE